MENEKTFQMVDVLGREKGMLIILQVEMVNGVENGYCVQYAGNGHYFGTKEAAQEYALKRWKASGTFQNGNNHGTTSKMETVGEGAE